MEQCEGGERLDNKVSTEDDESQIIGEINIESVAGVEYANEGENASVRSCVSWHLMKEFDTVEEFNESEVKAHLKNYDIKKTFETKVSTKVTYYCKQKNCRARVRVVYPHTTREVKVEEADFSHVHISEQKRVNFR